MWRHKGWSTAWVAATAAGFVASHFALFAWLRLSASLWNVLYIGLIEFFVIGLAYDIAALALGALVPICRIPRRSELAANAPAVAVLCTTCDDIDLTTLQSVSAQNYPNVETFVLDDSADAHIRAALDATRLTVVRRGTRRGYKAGNLNDWFHRHGDRFDYLVIADADSRLPPDFVDEMVRYAEHPTNANVAMIESLITPWNTSTPFAALQGVLTPIHHRLSLGLMNRAGVALSAGHNNLVRTRALREIGGFNETYLAEDQATTVELIRRGWRCVVVPIGSQERVPGNVAEYVRRETRWAYQTFQLSSLSTRGLPAACTLRLVMSLHQFARPVALLMTFVLMVVASVAAWDASGVHVSTSAASGSVALWLAFFLVPLCFQGLAGLGSGVSLPSQWRALLLYQALGVACAGPILRRLVRAAVLGDSEGFNRTGRARSPGLLQILRITATGVALAWAALIATVPWCGESTIALQLVWLGPAAAAPFLLHRLQSEAYA